MKTGVSWEQIQIDYAVSKTLPLRIGKKEKRQGNFAFKSCAFSNLLHNL